MNDNQQALLVFAGIILGGAALAITLVAVAVGWLLKLAGNHPFGG